MRKERRRLCHRKPHYACDQSIVGYNACALARGNRHKAGFRERVHALSIGDRRRSPAVPGALREAVTGLFERVEIAEAGSFDEVTKLLEGSGEVDLIMLDLTMPGVRGFSGLMYLRAQYPSVPIVVVSANDDPAVIRRCMDFGGAGFIPKTLGIDVIRTAIKRVLEGGVWTPPDVDFGSGTDAASARPAVRGWPR